MLKNPFYKIQHNFYEEGGGVNLYNDVWPFGVHPKFQTVYCQAQFIDDYVAVLIIVCFKCFFKIPKKNHIYWHICLSPGRSIWRTFHNSEDQLKAAQLQQ